MALTSCPECGNVVSTSAASCPKCGAFMSPQKIRIIEPIISVGDVQCVHCLSIITPQKMQIEGISAIIAFLLLCLGIIPGLIYIIWKRNRKICPVCMFPVK